MHIEERNIRERQSPAEPQQPWPHQPEIRKINREELTKKKEEREPEVYWGEENY